MNVMSSTVGWREWAALPDLDIPAVKVRFHVQPLQRNNSLTIRTQAPLVDIRSVSDSGGHTESRFVISSTLQLGPINQQIDITLTERHSMLFRMLIGRTALADNVLVDPAASFLCGRMSTRLLYSSHTEVPT